MSNYSEQGGSALVEVPPGVKPQVQIAAPSSSSAADAPAADTPAADAPAAAAAAAKARGPPTEDEIKASIIIQV